MGCFRETFCTFFMRRVPFFNKNSVLFYEMGTLFQETFCIFCARWVLFCRNCFVCFPKGGCHLHRIFLYFPARWVSLKGFFLYFGFKVCDFPVSHFSISSLSVNTSLIVGNLL